ncbi:MAG TPA: hypothetical protein VEZ70_14440 [Allosphingosinicella sp.]|nr:hypothetical protein [Allosphingosinicella sp.]
MADPDGEPLKLRVAASQSDAQLAASDVLAALKWPLREMAANLLRVVRGAGKPYEIGSNAATVLRAFQDYRAVVGHYPSSDEIAALLDIKPDPARYEGASDDYISQGFAMQQVMRGGLQLAASTLLDQSTQKAAARSEILDGVDAFERAFERLRGEVKPSFTKRKSGKSRSARTSPADGIKR